MTYDRVRYTLELQQLLDRHSTEAQHAHHVNALTMHIRILSCKYIVRRKRDRARPIELAQYYLFEYTRPHKRHHTNGQKKRNCRANQRYKLELRGVTQI
jgi:hypothetical protein